SDYTAAREEWTLRERAFWLSQPGRELQRNLRHYTPIFTADGGFRIDDVLPGTYQLTIRVSDPKVPDAFMTGNYLGSVEQEITVPEASSDTEQSQLDLGVLQLSVPQ